MVFLKLFYQGPISLKKLSGLNQNGHKKTTKRFNFGFVVCVELEGVEPSSGDEIKIAFYMLSIGLILDLARYHANLN